MKYRISRKGAPACQGDSADHRELFRNATACGLQGDREEFDCIETSLPLPLHCALALPAALQEWQALLLPYLDSFRMFFSRHFLRRRYSKASNCRVAGNFFDYTTLLGGPQVNGPTKWSRSRKAPSHHAPLGQCSVYGEISIIIFPLRPPKKIYIYARIPPHPVPLGNGASGHCSRDFVMILLFCTGAGSREGEGGSGGWESGGERRRDVCIQYNRHRSRHQHRNGHRHAAIRSSHYI